MVGIADEGSGMARRLHGRGLCSTHDSAGLAVRIYVWPADRPALLHPFSSVSCIAQDVYA